MVDTRLWGKSEGLPMPYPLVGHLVDTAVVCGAVWDSVLSAAQRRRIAEVLAIGPEQARRVVMFWAGLHDLGKITPGFQWLAARTRTAACGFLDEAAYAEGVLSRGGSGAVRHEYATHRALPQLLARLGYAGSGGRLARLLLAQVSQVLGGHHGRYPEGIELRDLQDPVGNTRELGAGVWAEQRWEHVAALHEVLGQPVVPVCGASPVEVAVVIAGMVIVSDWIASQEHVILRQQKRLAGPADFGSDASLAAHARALMREAPDLLEEAGLGRAALRGGTFAELFPEIARPYDLQRSVEAGLSGAIDGPGILLVTAPTGEGKTETAFYAASLLSAACGTSGLFFALPTQATANQMYGRMASFAASSLLESAALTLLHGAADLYEPYGDAGRGGSEPRVLSEAEGAGGTGAVSVEASRWLRGRGRGILAPLAVATIDQALMGVLPLKRNALRHLGLSGKTVVVDEAHAFDAYTHALLLRLLEWLGAMGVPVVLLSATLTGETARGLVQAYLSGADPRATRREVPSPAYPGWLFASLSGRVIEPVQPVRSERERELHVEVRHVTHTYDPSCQDGWLAALLVVLEGVVAGGGCVAVICTTVAEAQQTYQALRTHWRSRFGEGYAGWDDASALDRSRDDAQAGPRLRLLHARFPAGRRSQITAEAEAWFGRADKPHVRRPQGPRGAVLVATQIIEQSLDIDFDLVVCDLAPMAMLLQRAGRVWRHQAPRSSRPAWAHRPRLVVLAPVAGDGKLAVPKGWGDVYDPSLLQRTLELLEQRKGADVAVPGDVQELIDAVYADEFASSSPEQLFERDWKRLADGMARRALADMVMLPAPHKVSSLHTLTTSDADEDLVRTRLGVESVQVLPVFEDSQGRWLDQDCTVEFPTAGHGPNGRFATGQVRTLLGFVTPLAHGRWRAACGPEHAPPLSCRDEPRLAQLVLLPHRVEPGGTVTGARLGDDEITCHRDLGLVLQRDV
ncbi:CRISPR-associated endonuclease Cas3'' [Streptomyces sp. NPDC059991]|uniref:CRISPR-associated endonuclease Cas3'' n=1 Tax=Streptomyces sp. NPDC059991 TaxID=3347028 RepID=UPI00368BC8AD